MKNKLILFVICFSLSYSFSQDYFIKYINTEIEIDGVEDKLWSEVSKSSDYWQWRPSDSIKAKNQTNFKALYDDKNLYFLIKSKRKFEKTFNIKIEYLENRNLKNLKNSNKYLGSKIFLSYYFKGIRLIDNF